MTPFALPAGLATQQQQQQQQAPASPFQWGAGGRRMTPEQIAREREIANAMMGVDYLPIASPWQGLARVSENLLGGLRERGARKAEQANMQYSDEILASLMNPGGLPSATGAPGVASPAPGANGLVEDGRIARMAAADPYLSPQVRAMAQRQLDMQDFERKQRIQAQSDTWDDNAGNRWRLGANGMPEMIFLDRNAKRIPQKVFDADGNEFIEYVEIPNAYGPGGQPLQPQPQTMAPMTELPPGYEIEGPPPIGAAPPRVDEASALAKARSDGDAYLRSILEGRR